MKVGIRACCAHVVGPLLASFAGAPGRRLAGLVLAVAAGMDPMGAFAATPYSARFIYFIPSDRTQAADFAAGIANGAVKLQRWYPDQVGGKTIRLNDPIVEVCKGSQPASYFSTSSYSRVFNAVKACFPGLVYNDPLHRWVIYADVRHACNAPERLGAGGSGVTIMPVQDLEGLAARPVIVNDCGDSNSFVGPAGVNRWIGGLGHELGHALGLPHPPGCDQAAPACDSRALMWAGYASFPNTFHRDDERPVLLGGPFFFPKADAMLPQLGAAAGIAFGGQSMGTTSAAQTLTLTNDGGGTLTIGSINVSNPGFRQTHDCTSLAASASCTVTLTFSPEAMGGALNSTTTVTAGLTIASNAWDGPKTVALSGTAEKSLVTHYYRSILRRPPDAGGKAFWSSEAQRVQALGASVNEVWFAMAQAFYVSAEYAAFNRGNTGFVTDLYTTFFNRAPDGGGLAFWVGQLDQGMPREVALASFMFSAEFVNFNAAIFGNVSARAEVNTVVDFYRGLLSRSPDDGGFDFWVGRFRTAQCQGSAAIINEVEAISSAYVNSAEYAGRGRTNAQYVGDLYNAFLRRGGDLPGVQFWIDQVNTGARTREQVRVAFKDSPEFQARVNAIIAQGCLQ